MGIGCGVSVQARRARVGRSSHVGNLGTRAIVVGQVEMTADGGGDGRDAEVQIAIDDISEGMAAARVVSTDFVDYLHLVSTSHGWRIANVLFRNRG